jgi:hypothetical protein
MEIVLGANAASSKAALCVMEPCGRGSVGISSNVNAGFRTDMQNDAAIPPVDSTARLPRVQDLRMGRSR